MGPTDLFPVIATMVLLAAPLIIPMEVIASPSVMGKVVKPLIPIPVMSMVTTSLLMFGRLLMVFLGRTHTTLKALLALPRGIMRTAAAPLTIMISRAIALWTAIRLPAHCREYIGARTILMSARAAGLMQRACMGRSATTPMTDLP